MKIKDELREGALSNIFYFKSEQRRETIKTSQRIRTQRGANLHREAGIFKKTIDLWECLVELHHSL